MNGWADGPCEVKGHYFCFSETLTIRPCDNPDQLEVNGAVFDLAERTTVNGMKPSSTV